MGTFMRIRYYVGNIILGFSIGMGDGLDGGSCYLKQFTLANSQFAEK